MFEWPVALPDANPTSSWCCFRVSIWLLFNNVLGVYLLSDGSVCWFLPVQSVASLAEAGAISTPFVTSQRRRWRSIDRVTPPLNASSLSSSFMAVLLLGLFVTMQRINSQSRLLGKGFIPLLSGINDMFSVIVWFEVQLPDLVIGSSYISKVIFNWLYSLCHYHLGAWNSVF